MWLRIGLILVLIDLLRQSYCQDLNRESNDDAFSFACDPFLLDGCDGNYESSEGSAVGSLDSLLVVKKVKKGSGKGKGKG